MNRNLEYFLYSSAREIQDEYKRIYKETQKDPGTAGDQGEENWADLLRGWLPSNFHIRTKGRILGFDGKESNQVDVIILKPEYPQKLLSKKLYLEGGVIACFECKNTLKKSHFKPLFENSLLIKELSNKRQGSPYKELHSPILYGLLAHSHSWKSDKSKPLAKIVSELVINDSQIINSPLHPPDLLCVADLGMWSLMKSIVQRRISTAYMERTIATQSEVKEYFPIGSLIASLYRKIGWEYPSIQPMANYFRQARIGGHGSGNQRFYNLNYFSENVLNNYDKIPFEISVWNEYTLFFE